MPFPWDLLITGAMATTAALGGALVAGHLGRSAEREAWHRSDLVSAVRGVLDGQSDAYFSMTLAETVEQAEQIDWRPWNQALHRLQVTGGADLVEAANRLDEAIWLLSTEQRQRGWLGADWDPLANEIDRRLLDFTNAARRSLGISDVLARGHGKPGVRVDRSAGWVGHEPSNESAVD